MYIRKWKWREPCGIKGRINNVELAMIVKPDIILLERAQYYAAICAGRDVYYTIWRK